MPQSQALATSKIRGVHNYQHRFRVRREILQLSIRRQRVHRHDHRADARRGEPQQQELRAVCKHQQQFVRGPHVERQQGIRGTVHLGGKIRVAESQRRVVHRLEDQERLVRM